MENLTVAKYRAGQQVYSYLNKNYLCPIIKIEARFIGDEFITWAYKLQFPDELPATHSKWVMEHSITLKKSKSHEKVQKYNYHHIAIPR